MKSYVFLVAISLFSINSMALNCLGTEPFWGAEISKDKVVLEGPGYETPVTLPVMGVASAAGMSASFMRILTNNNGPVAIVTARKCSDGMSDNTYPSEVLIFTGSSVLYGCCGKGVEVSTLL